ncbi:tRNA lysidine(34) synthetase TilS [Povalibacter sp.]|uniref:tRNA lysidine(34) synthetase TilS n=1 Tax=Povalibacter sp. TaxID=1962978 RepID=UPI002F3E7FE6
MIFSPATLLAIVRSHLPAAASGRLCVAFSGGLDSTVLLAALAQGVRDDSSYTLRAIHIDHDLHADSSRWSQHCAAVAQRLGVDYVSRTVSVARDAGAGLEAAARDARYAALREHLRPGDVLLSAHHADDQFETLLLALLRGAGLAGLAAMPVSREFHPGWHLRPLLDFTRSALEDWATSQQLVWIADPSNDSRRFDRNFLRQDVIPLMRSRWPAASQSAARSASHVGEGLALMDEQAQTDLATASAGPCLRVDVLSGLSVARRRNLLRYWTRLRGARAPSTRKLLALEHDMLVAQEDRLPVTQWDGFEVRRFRGLLYAESTREWSADAAAPVAWDWSRPMTLPDQLGVLCAQDVRGSGLSRALLSSTLRVEFRHGGEVIRPAGQRHHRSLKKLLQDADILPWWRSRLPLLWMGDQLVAVGDLWTADEFAAREDDEGVQVIWQGRPPIQAQPQVP